MAHPDSTIKVVDQEENGPGASVRTEKVALVSRGKLIDKPSTVINTQGRSLGWEGSPREGNGNLL